MNQCEGCKYWSSQHYEVIDYGPIRCKCLNEVSGFYGMMMAEGCTFKAYGNPIDKEEMDYQI